MPESQSTTQAVNPRIAVVMVNYNGIEDTLECLESMRSQLDSSTFAVVVDNDSASDDLDRIRSSFPEVTLFCNPINQGWSGGNNRGIEQAMRLGADWILLLNNDTIVSPDIFERLRLAIRIQTYSILGVVIHEYVNRTQIQTEGVRFNPAGSKGFFETIATPEAMTDPPTITHVDIVNGCAVMIAREVFDNIGLIDERFFLICEESDFCLRAQARGYRAGVMHETHVWHKHSVSFARAVKPLQRYYGTRNLGLLLAKHWGGHGRRGFWSSYFTYLRHLYHIFCLEKERGNETGASAIMIGLRDFVLARFGNQPIQASWFSKLLGWLAASIWSSRGGKVATTTERSTVGP